MRRPDLIGCGRHTGWSNLTLASGGAERRGDASLGVARAVLVEFGESLFEASGAELVVGFGWWLLADGEYGGAVWSVVDDLSVGSSFDPIFAAVFSVVVVFAANRSIVLVCGAVILLPFVNMVDFGEGDRDVAASKIAAAGHQLGGFACCAGEQALLAAHVDDHTGRVDNNPTHMTEQRSFEYSFR